MSDALRVADAMVTIPVTHPREATVADMRRLFLDEHVHMALLLDGRLLVAAVEREDLDPMVAENGAAGDVGSLRGRTIPADASVSEAFESMRAASRRRLAVTNERGELVGLLCLKTSGAGFCSDADVRSRKQPDGRT
jgi:predicted transcriptional regulator